MNALERGFGDLQQALFEAVVQPLLFAAGLGNILEDAWRGTGWLLVGLLQIVVITFGFGALQRWRPVEVVNDRAAVRVDVIYTLIHRLGLFRLVMFFTLDPLWDALVGRLRVAGLPAWSLDQVWPGVSDVALVSFLLYLLLFDALDYLLHRAQHRFDWWWQLHALHHSQRQMTMWSDNRNHLLDDVLRDAAVVVVGLLVGIAPAQFVAVVATAQLLESLSHTNVRLDFGPWLGRLLVSPRYHRAHHAIEPAPAEGLPRSANYAVLFPLWDLLGGTARWVDHDAPTGVIDQLPDHGGRDYGRGWWAQQALGLQRLARALAPRRA